MEHRIPAPGTHLCGLAWDGTTLWHSDAGTATIYALDPQTGTVRFSLRCPGVRTDLTWAGELLVQVIDTPKRLCYLRPTGGVAGFQPVEPPTTVLCGLEASGDQLWLGYEVPPTIQLRDLETLTVQRELPVEGRIAGLTCLPNLVIYADHENSLIRSVDAISGEIVGRLKVSGSPTGLTWDGSRLWYCDYDSHEICAIEPDGLLR